MDNKSIMIIAGEASGDLHGASLIREIKNHDNSVKICGIGGDKMRSEGMEIIFHIDKMAFLGFVEIIKHLPFIKKIQRLMISEVIKRKVKQVVLIDYPGFNLSIAKKLYKLKPENKPELIYYITPQVWAWGKKRVYKIKKFFSKVLVVFPFEEKFFKNNNVDAEYVGHPLIQEMQRYEFVSRNTLIKKFDLDPNKEIILVLPGSRYQEIKNIFPESIKAAVKLADDFEMQVVVACSGSINEEIFFKLYESRDYKVIKNYTYDLLKYSKFGIIKSGTSTLESGLMGLPMVIVYKTSWLTFLIAKLLVKIENIGMVNILLDENIIPELIQDKATAENIYLTSQNILSDEDIFNSLKLKLSRIKDQLGNKNAPSAAAKSIFSLIDEHKAS